MSESSGSEVRTPEEISFEYKKLASRIANLCDQDSWPDRLARLTANQALAFIESQAADLDGVDIAVLSEWVDVASKADSVALENEKLWDACPYEFYDHAEELKVDADAEEPEAAGESQSADSSDGEGDSDDDSANSLSDAEVLIKACTIVAGYVEPKAGAIPTTDEVTKFISHLDSTDQDALNSLLDWCDDVIDTHESGASLRANGGELLNVPACIRDWFDWDAEARAIEKTLAERAGSQPAIAPPSEEVKAQPSGCDSQKSVPQNQRPETSLEAIMRIERELPNAWKMLEDAKSVAESRKAAHDAAKKHVDAMQLELNRMVEELTEAINGFNGGDYQYRLPFDRVSQDSSTSNSVATASPDGAAKSGTKPENAASNPVGLVAADPISGESVAVLVADQLSAKTNGKSDGVGIPQGTVDLLVDASLGTIGLLEKHMRKRGEFWAKDVKGVGPGKADKIVAALGVLRQCFPIPVADAEPLEELIIEDAAYMDGKISRESGGPRVLPNGISPTGHQGRSWLLGYDDTTAGTPEPAVVGGPDASGSDDSEDAKGGE